MNIKLIIPTLGRMDKQITYDNFPAKYQKDVHFVVQAHEFEEMKSRYPNNQVHCLPVSIKNIQATRQWIAEKFSEDRIWVWDDDVMIRKSTPNAEGQSPKWLTEAAVEHHFDELFEMAIRSMDAGFVHGSVQTCWIIPSVTAWPLCSISRNMTNVFYDMPNVPKDVRYDRVECAEDFDILMQLLLKGYENIIITKYRAFVSETNAEGGCSIWRTLEKHNASQMHLQSLYPDYVTTRTKPVKSGVWKGQDKVSVTIQMAKAAKVGLKARGISALPLPDVSNITTQTSVTTESQVTQTDDTVEMPDM